MNNAIIITIYDRTQEQYDLSVQTVASAMAQDIPVDIFIVDNGSTCEKTKEWLHGLGGCYVYRRVLNESPCRIGNMFLQHIFGMGHQHVLGLPNDVICPPNLYRKLLEREEWLVTPGMHGDNPPQIIESPERIHGDCHMSVVMLRKQGYDALVAQDGAFFDEGFFMYASDCDVKCRLSMAKVPTAQLDILCWHYGGASHRLGIGAQAAYVQADRDRDYFKKKWGFAVGDKEYDNYIIALG